MEAVPTLGTESLPAKVRLAQVRNLAKFVLKCGGIYDLMPAAATKQTAKSDSCLADSRHDFFRSGLSEGGVASSSPCRKLYNDQMHFSLTIYHVTFWATVDE